MPCVDGREREDDERTWRDLNERTAQLCRVYRVMERVGCAYLIPPEDLAWWTEHKILDARRSAK